MIRMIKQLIRTYSIPIVFLLSAALCAETIALLSPQKSVEPAPPEPSPSPSAEVEQIDPLVTAEQIAQLSYQDSTLGKLCWELSQEALSDLNRVLLQYGICAPEEICQFLAQATVESAAGRQLTESGDEAYFQSRGYTTGTRGAGYLHLTYEYGQMAFSTWMMKTYVPELASIRYVDPANHGKEEISAAYYQALKAAADLGLDVSSYTRIVFNSNCSLPTGADYIASEFAWESAAYYWNMSGISEAFSETPGVENTDIASARVGGGNWQSRREAYLAFSPVFL